MFFLALSFAAVAIPYGLERLYFKKTLGPFAILFWLLVFQWSVLLSGQIILQNQLAQSLPNWINSIGFAIGFLAYITIGFIPLTAVLAALVAMIVLAFERFGKKSSENSD